MRKNKKPAIASEWRENKEAQDRAEQQAERERLRADRSRRFAGVSAFCKHLLASTGWVVAIVLEEAGEDIPGGAAGRAQDVLETSFGTSVFLSLEELNKAVQ